jgi:hypothetical protein
MELRSERKMEKAASKAHRLGASISSLIPAVSCRRCSPNAPFAKLKMLTA